MVSCLLQWVHRCDMNARCFNSLNCTVVHKWPREKIWPIFSWVLYIGDSKWWVLSAELKLILCGPKKIFEKGCTSRRPLTDAILQYRYWRMASVCQWTSIYWKLKLQQLLPASSELMIFYLDRTVFKERLSHGRSFLKNLESLTKL